MSALVPGKDETNQEAIPTVAKSVPIAAGMTYKAVLMRQLGTTKKMTPPKLTVPPPTSSNPNNYENWDPNKKRPDHIKKWSQLPPQMKTFASLPPQRLEHDMSPKNAAQNPLTISPQTTPKSQPCETVDLTDTADKKEEKTTRMVKHTRVQDTQSQQKEVKIPEADNVTYTKMSDKDRAWLDRHVDTLPEPPQDITAGTPELGYLPIGLFNVTLEPEGYPPSQRDFSRMLLRKGREVIPALIKHDLQTVRELPKMNGYVAKCFFFKKYFVTTREFRQITGFSSFAEAIRRTPHAEGQTQTGAPGRQRPNAPLAKENEGTFSRLEVDGAEKKQARSPQDKKRLHQPEESDEEKHRAKLPQVYRQYNIDRCAPATVTKAPIPVLTPMEGAHERDPHDGAETQMPSSNSLDKEDESPEGSTKRPRASTPMKEHSPEVQGNQGEHPRRMYLKPMDPQLKKEGPKSTVGKGRDEIRPEQRPVADEKVTCPPTQWQNTMEPVQRTPDGCAATGTTLTPLVIQEGLKRRRMNDPAAATPQDGLADETSATTRARQDANASMDQPERERLDVGKPDQSEKNDQSLNERKKDIEGANKKPRTLADRASGVKQQPKKEPLADWECIDGVLCYRPTAIHRRDHPPSGEHSSQMDSTQSTIELGSQTTANEEHVPKPDDEPICEIQEEKDRQQNEPIQLQLLYRRNDLTTKEKMTMSQIFTDFGPSQRWDFVMPNAKQVVRCPYQGCNTLINSNGIQRSITVHFRQCHKEVTRPVVVKVKKADSFKVTTYLIPGRQQPPAQMQTPSPAQMANDPQEPTQPRTPSPSEQTRQEEHPPALIQEDEADADNDLGFEDDGITSTLRPTGTTDVERAMPEQEGMGPVADQNLTRPQQKLPTMDGRENPDPVDPDSVPDLSRNHGDVGQGAMNPNVHPAESMEVDTDSATVDPEQENALPPDRSHQVGTPEQTRCAADHHAAYLGLKTPRATQGRQRTSKRTVGGGQRGHQEAEEDDADMPGTQHINAVQGTFPSRNDCHNSKLYFVFGCLPFPPLVSLEYEPHA